MPGCDYGMFDLDAYLGTALPVMLPSMLAKAKPV
jgi:hypothetical protein